MAYNKKDNKYVGYIYCITNNVNNKKYIGQTHKTIHRRFSLHISDAKRGEGFALHAAIRKYGEENFNVIKLEEIKCLTLNELVKKLDEREIYWIEYYDTYNGYGYNAAAGGSFGNSVCREKYIPVDVYNLNGDLIYECESIAFASEITNVSETHISRCCKGLNKIAKNMYTFRYHGDPFDLYPVTYSIQYTVYQLNEDGELIKTYNSLKEAFNITGYNYDNLRAAIKYGRLFQGYYWCKENKIPERKIYDQRIPVDKYSLTGELLGEYNSIVEGGRSIGKDKDVIQSVLECCKGKRIYAYNYIWRFHGQPFSMYETNIINSQKKPFNLYTLDGSFIGVYEKISDVKNVKNIKYWKFQEYMGKGIHVVDSYVWYRIEDQDQPDKAKIKTLNEFLHEKYVLPILNQNPTN